MTGPMSESRNINLAALDMTVDLAYGSPLEKSILSVHHLQIWGLTVVNIKNHPRSSTIRVCLLKHCVQILI